MNDIGRVDVELAFEIVGIVALSFVEVIKIDVAQIGDQFLVIVAHTNTIIHGVMRGHCSGFVADVEVAHAVMGVASIVSLNQL